MSKKIFIFFPKDSEALFNINSERTFGGASVQLYNIARSLNLFSNNKVFSLIPEYQNISFPDQQDFNLIKTFKESDNTIKKFYQTHKIIRNNKPNIIIQRGLTLFSIFLSIYCFLFKIKFIFMFAHDRELNKRYQKNNQKVPLFYLLLLFSNKLIVQNSFQYNKIPKKYLKKTELLKSGYFLPKYEDIRKNNSILWVSRLEPWKCPEKFLKLAEMNPSLKFVLIGPIFHRENDYGEKISAECKKLKNIEYHSFINFPQINNFFSQASIFINTSDCEGFPNTFVQATMNATPIISLNVNPDSIFEKHKIGFYCNNSISVMNDKIHLLIENPKIYEKFSKNAYKYSKKEHDINKIALEIIK